MTTIEAVKLFCEKTGFALDSLEAHEFQIVLDDEIEHVNLKGYSAKIEEATDLIIGWYFNSKGVHYLNLDDISSIRRFVASHRIAFTWATLLGKEFLK